MKAKRHLALGLMALATTAACGQKGVPGGAMSTDSASIVSGTVVENGDPVLASTVGLAMKMANGQAACTGTLLSDKVLLTAAHCVPDGIERMAVIFSREFDKLSRETVRAGATAMRHPLWGKDDASGRGDIALVLFRGGIPEGFKPAELLPATEELDTGNEVIVTGYGVSDAAARSGSGVLRRTTMKILGLASPTEVVTDGHERSVCFGDSGGPSYVERAGHFYLWGVASAVTNSTCNQFAIHTDIATYEDWIREGVKKLTDAAASGALPSTPTPPAAPATPPTPAVPDPGAKPALPPAKAPAAAAPQAA